MLKKNEEKRRKTPEIKQESDTKVCSYSFLLLVLSTGQHGRNAPKLSILLVELCLSFNLRWPEPISGADPENSERGGRDTCKLYR